MWPIHDASCSLGISSFLQKARQRSHAHSRMSDYFRFDHCFSASYLSVFATRLGTSKPHWQPMGARYEWDRFAAGTTPRLPNTTKVSDRIRIPWPKRPERPKYECTFVSLSCAAIAGALKPTRSYSIHRKGRRRDGGYVQAFCASL